ncbi:Isd11 protein [Martiniozyma asiatica (nom. inval.)]|nr:Isd11 protein [Martiniozyma asiatica]
MAAVQSQRSNVLALYRAFIRTSNQFQNYNFKAYFLRKTRADFRASGEMTPELYQKALQDLQVLKRQATVSQMYHSDPIVLEKL